MGSRGPRLLRRTTNHVLDALLKAAEGAWQGHPKELSALRDIIVALEASAQFDDFYRRSYRELLDVVEQEKMELRRTNAFGRLMVHHLGPLFESGTLDRAFLPNIFSFFHLVLGDDAGFYGEQCLRLVADLKAELGEDFTWDAYYDTPSAKLILWHTLTRIAGSFKRWDLRKDWFMKLMQYTPTTVSLGSNAFVTREVDHDEPHVFGNHQFCAFFQALFSPLTEMKMADEAAFKKEFGTDPHHLIGPFLVHLATCEI
ncbi:hypothetical protein [Magnetospirillum gryphiswaldense]|uniref:Uncharacterized protein n=1 Tax=Magnetospirillum gryphiswaldense TaxID=55518 RepID=A4U4Y8_9PROT|nr:hypothetical protein [Magnetospirillum gryphiswaldense]AVM72764.1 hypothetical protein MSR1_02430 [Magnetospirillum gryphiswaldense MSR-1]AVM76667.1 hypothetical protein MSR1L_02430 [Magnetospirillum gryphiswaldense]CAM77945.1 hypothetical protein MGR_4013 [Magnetospirillum gryphiswaldense MSR-1]